MRILILIVAAMRLAGAQFEVASVKPSAIPPTHLAYVMSDTRVDLGFISLKFLIQTAYRVEAYQVSGPEWMATSRFDVLAKLPDGATKEQIPEMLQSLLADRFGLVLHKEPREQQVYALLIEKDGPKLKEGAADNSHPDLSFLNGRRLLTKMNTEDGGFWTISQLNGPRIFDASRITLPELARTLTAYVDIPVVDMTGLKGAYQVSLEVPLEIRAAALRMAALTSTGAIAPGDTPETTWGASIFKSVQKLGLTLEKRKAPVETLVIDHAEKVPTEN